MTAAFYEHLIQKIGENNTNKLRKIKVGIAGAGGLGSNCAMNLVRAGFGNLKIIDYDIVEVTNLDRQFYFADQVGMYKVEALRQNLLRINPAVQIEIEVRKIDQSMVERLFADCLIVAECLERKKIDSCYGDIDYVDGCKRGSPVRAWRAGEYHRNRFKWGWMPPHPTFFARRALYEKYGLFNLDFKLAADYELMLRFLYKHHVLANYIPKCLVTMRTGGACKPGIANTLSNMAENYRAWKVNALRPNPLTFVLKPLSKIGQYARFRSVRSKE